MPERGEFQNPVEDILVDKPEELAREIAFREDEVVAISRFIKGFRMLADEVDIMLHHAGSVSEASKILDLADLGIIELAIERYSSYMLPGNKGVWLKPPRFLRDNMREKLEFPKSSGGEAKAVVVPLMPNEEIFVVDYWRNLEKDTSMPDYNLDDERLYDSALGYVLRANQQRYEFNPVIFESEQLGFTPDEIMLRVAEELQLAN